MMPGRLPSPPIMMRLSTLTETSRLKLDGKDCPQFGREDCAGPAHPLPH